MNLMVIFLSIISNI